MTEIGLVVEVGNAKVKIKVPRTSACGGSCAQCAAECGGRAEIYTAENTLGLQVGDRVRLTMPNGRFAADLLLGYGVPAAALFGGIALGYFLLHEDGKALLMGLAIFLLSIFAQRLLFKNRRHGIKIEKIVN